MHIAKDCTSPYRVSFSLQKDSIFTKIFDRVIERIKESGLIQKWTNEELYRARLHSSQQNRATSSGGGDRNVFKITVGHIQGPLMAYFALILISVGIFLAEVALNMAKRSKKTAVNKDQRKGKLAD